MVAGSVPHNRSGAAVGGSGWAIKAFLFDFTAQPDQTLDTDGVVSYGGLNWTKKFSANELVAMASVNGTGLVVKPSLPGSFNATTTYTQPRLCLPVLSALPNAGPGTAMRIWVHYTVAGNPTAFCCSTWAYEGTVAPASSNLNVIYTQRGVLSAGDGRGFGQTITGGANDVASAVNTGDLDVMQIPRGIAGQQASLQVGTYVAGWPAQNTLLPCSVSNVNGTSNPTSGVLSGHTISFGGQTFGTDTPSFTFKHLRVDVLQDW